MLDFINPHKDALDTRPNVKVYDDKEVDASFATVATEITAIQTSMTSLKTEIDTLVAQTEYTYFVKDTTTLEAWFNNKAGNDYTHVCILGKEISYTIPTGGGITALDNRNTKTITGLAGNKLILTGRPSTNIFRYDTRPTTPDYFIKGLNIQYGPTLASTVTDITLFYNCINIVDCTVIAKGNISTAAFTLHLQCAFLNCVNLYNCTVYIDDSIVDSPITVGSAYFKNCDYLYNCVADLDSRRFDGIVVANAAIYFTGYANCNYINNCKASYYIDKVLGSMSRDILGFYTCTYLIGCNAYINQELTATVGSYTFIGFSICTMLTRNTAYVKNSSMSSDARGYDFHTCKGMLFNESIYSIQSSYMNCTTSFDGTPIIRPSNDFIGGYNKGSSPAQIPVPISLGGTGANTVAGAQANLGLAGTVSQYTYIISDVTQFNNWINGVAGNNYAHVLIMYRSSGYTINSMVNLFNLGTKTVTGASNVSIEIAPYGGFTYGSKPTNISALSFNNIYFIVSYNASFNWCYNFNNCYFDANIFNLSTVLFKNCANFINCIFSSASVQQIFDNCSNIVDCEIQFRNQQQNVFTKPVFNKCNNIVRCIHSIKEIVQNPVFTMINNFKYFKDCSNILMNTFTLDAIILRDQFVYTIFETCNYIMYCTLKVTSTKTTASDITEFYGFDHCTYILGCKSSITTTNPNVADKIYSFYHCLGMWFNGPNDVLNTMATYFECNVPALTTYDPTAPAPNNSAVGGYNVSTGSDVVVPVPIEFGGTGASTLAGAQANLGITGGGGSIDTEYTYVVKDQASFDAWVANTAGNDYTSVLLMPNVYSLVNTLNLTTTGTLRVKGMPGATIDIDSTLAATVTECIKYDLLPETDLYSFEGVRFIIEPAAAHTLSLTILLSLRNLSNCAIQYTPGFIRGLNFVARCYNIDNVTINTSGVNAAAYNCNFFMNCEHLYNCKVDAVFTSTTSMVVGANDCKYIFNCNILLGTLTDTSVAIYAFLQCYHVLNCLGGVYAVGQTTSKAVFTSSAGIWYTTLHTASNVPVYQSCFVSPLGVGPAPSDNAIGGYNQLTGTVGPVAIADGGTGAVTAAAARANLGITDAESEYTYIVRDQASFNVWVNNVITNDYTYVLLLAGTYILPKTLNLTATGTRRVYGVPGANIWLNNTFNSTDNVGILYTIAPYSDDYSFEGINFRIAPDATQATILECIQSLRNIRNCTVTFDPDNASEVYLFVSCTNVYNVKVYSNKIASSEAHIFIACNNLYACTFKAELVYATNSYITGINSCKFLYNCEVFIMLLTSDTTTAEMAAFKDCINLIDCIGGLDYAGNLINKIVYNNCCGMAHNKINAQNSTPDTMVYYNCSAGISNTGPAPADNAIGGYNQASIASSDIIPIIYGGTGASTAAQAKANLGIIGLETEYTYIITDQASFDAFATAAIGNDYRSVFIDKGNYTLTGTINLETSLTERVVGEAGNNILCTGAVAFTYQTDLSAGEKCWIKGLNLTLKPAAMGTATGFKYCANPSNCTVKFDNTGGMNIFRGFDTCYNPTACFVYDVVNAASTSDEFGFEACLNLQECRTVLLSANVAGFKDCFDVISCAATGTSDSGNIYGFNGCSQLLHCTSICNGLNNTVKGIAYRSCHGMQNNRCAFTGSIIAANRIPYDSCSVSLSGAGPAPDDSALGGYNLMPGGVSPLKITPIEFGGTGADNAKDARDNLGFYSRFTYIVDSDQALLDWADGVASHDYSAVLIAPGTYDLPDNKSIDLDHSGTLTVIGMPNSVITINALQGIKSNAIRNYAQYIEGITIRLRDGAPYITDKVYELFHLLTNLHNCSALCSNVNAVVRGYSECDSLYDCLTELGMIGDFCAGYTSCHRLYNCKAWVNITDNFAHAVTAYGFQACSLLDSCIAYASNDRSATETHAIGYHQCNMMTHCFGEATTPNGSSGLNALDFHRCYGMSFNYASMAAIPSADAPYYECHVNMGNNGDPPADTATGGFNHYG